MIYRFRERLQNVPAPALTLAVAVHIVFFSTTTFHIPALTTEHRTEVAFLGAILDSFEVEKLRNEGGMAPDVAAILSKPNKSAGKSVTSTAKPRLTQQVYNKPKNFIKTAPGIAETSQQAIPARPARTPPNSTEPQPYQRLKL